MSFEPNTLPQVADDSSSPASADAAAAGAPPMADLIADLVQTHHAYLRRQLPRVQVGRPTGSSPVDTVVIVLVVLLALFIAAQLASHSLIDLSFAQDVGERLGVVRPRRPAVTHALWLLVLVKLLTPPIIELPLPWSIARSAAFDLP